MPASGGGRVPNPEDGALVCLSVEAWDIFSRACLLIFPRQGTAQRGSSTSSTVSSTKGLVIAGDIKVSLAEVELLTIRIRLLVCSLDKAQEIGLDWWR